MHEMYHAQLALGSNVGILMHLIELELNSEQDDWQYMTKLISIRKYLYESTRTVQEVYANSLEMLWVEEHYGMEVRNHVYERKTIEYKQYLDTAKKNTCNVSSGASSMYIADPNAVKIKVYLQDFGKWVQQVFYLSEDNVTEIS